MASRLLSVFLLALFCCTCQKARPRTPALAEAYVGPITLQIRQELALNSPVVATLKHGDRLEVVSTRRRFIRVRTSFGTEGWTDSRHLLTSEHMASLRRLAESSAKLISQGEAKVYETLNVHTEPERQSPSG